MYFERLTVFKNQSHQLKTGKNLKMLYTRMVTKWTSSLAVFLRMIQIVSSENHPEKDDISHQEVFSLVLTFKSCVGAYDKCVLPC